MGIHDVMQVCEKGHVINDNFKSMPQFNREFCNECGAKTLHQCPTCGKDIKGEYHVEGVAVIRAGSPTAPDFCEYCGATFPWKSEDQNDEKLAVNDHCEFLIQVLEKFPLFVRQLQNRQRKREPFTVNDEYDVQDLLNAILRLHFDDIRPEEWVPSYAGSSSRMDFLLKDENIVIEAKKTRDNLKDKEVGEQLIVDIKKYQEHPHCKILICFVYDPKFLISNPNGLEKDLAENQENLTVKVVIVPR